MIAAWLWDLLTKARRKESVQAPEQQDLSLTDFGIDQMLQSESDCIYEVSRTEPFRLRHVRASEAPVTPALINRTVTTILGIMEPGQPRLGREFCQALRTVTPDAPTQLRYQSTHHGVLRVATIFDLGPEHDRLYAHCSTNDSGEGPPSPSASPIRFLLRSIEVSGDLNQPPADYKT